VFARRRARATGWVGTRGTCRSACQRLNRSPRPAARGRRGRRGRLGL